MSEIINSTYEIIGKLGSGGGGVVYLAEHLRLGKKVVLKADKRNVNTKTSLLRREVDVLKELNNPYIPVVYDYFVENETSFTVMDYVDGTSLDKLLKKQKNFSAPDVIRWARQLLCALSYLHSPTHGDPPKGYIHSDIKPANIMLRPNGNICLIDFNIALAIGIETVVGKSEGYSSPEHYGLDYSFGSKSDDTIHRETEKTELKNEETELVDRLENNHRSPVSNISSSFGKLVVPDARSDIYSVGATMYHLLSGKKPARNAVEVEPLSRKQFSPLLTDIITKAMNPNPDLRFASADEMLETLDSLWINDPRVKMQRKRFVAGSTVIALLLLAGIGAVLCGIKQTERIKAGQVLAAEAADAISKGDTKSAVRLALQALPETPGAFDIPYTAAAELALTDALGVYDLSDSFKADKIIALPSAPFRLIISPNGSRLVVCYAYEATVYDIDSGSLIKALPTLSSALCEAEFVNEDVILYSSDSGLTAYDISNDAVLWQGEKATAITLSGDKKIAAAVYKNETEVYFYDVSNGEIISSRSLGDRHFNIPENDRYTDVFRDVFELNENGSVLGISLSGGYLGIMDIYDEGEDIIIYEDSDYTRFNGGFTGDIFAFCADNPNGSVFGMADYKATEFIGKMDGADPFDMKIYKDDLYISQNDSAVIMDTLTFEQTPVFYTENKNILSFDISDKYAIAAYNDGWQISFKGAGVLQANENDEAADFVLITNNYAVIGSRNSPIIQLLKKGSNSESILMEYDPIIPHSEARLSVRNGNVMLFDIYRFTVLETDGSVKFFEELPDPDKIYDQQYRRDNGEYLEITYYSGRQLCYSAEDGSLLAEREITPPSSSLDEEFETSEYIVKAPLHGAPTVYSKTDGKFVKELRGEDHLTYITETGDTIIAQYIRTADGGAYGVMMNCNWEEIALLPCLCDVIPKSSDHEAQLIFDLPGGCIKTSPVYNLSQLREMADTE